MFNFANSHRKGNNSPLKREHSLQLEALEERALLSALPWNTEAADAVPAIIAPAAATQENVVIPQVLLESPQALESDPGVVSDGIYTFNETAYNAHEVECLQTFFEQIDEDGVTNGAKMFGDAYDVNDPSAWLNADDKGATFEEIDGVMRLTQLNLENGDLVGDLNVSGCTALVEVLAGHIDGLTSVNVSGCTALTGMETWFDDNLTSVDASGCTALDTLSCCDDPNLTSMDITGCNALTNLACFNTSLTELDVSGRTELTDLAFGNCPITSLDVSGCASLDGVFFDNNTELASLNMSGCTMLSWLDLTGLSNLTSLNLSGCATLEYLDASVAESLVTLDVSGCTALTTLELSGLSNLTTLNMSGCTALQWEDGKLNTSPVDNGLKLNSLVTLDVSGCTQLQSLFAYLHESLTTLNASGCTSLDYVGAYENANLVSVDLSGCTALTALDLPANPNMTEMNITGCTALGYLSCLNTALTSLDISECAELYQLECNGTQISILDAYNCPALEYLVCWSANLEYVIINQDLEYLYLELYDENFDTTWTFQAADETILSSDGTSYEYSAENVSELPVTATSADESQTIRIVTKTPMDAPTLTATLTSINSVTVTVSADEDASGYVLEYSANEDFSDAVSQNVSAGDTTITGLDTNASPLYFRVKALTGNIFLLDSDFTDAQSVFFYDANETAKLQAFFEQADDEGVTNGAKIFGDAYDVNDPNTWFNDNNEGATFQEVDGVMRLISLDLGNYGVVGALDVSGCDALETLYCFDNQLTSLNVSGCSALFSLDCSDNQLTSIDVSGCESLLDLTCWNNQLTSLDTSECAALTGLYCYNNQLESLDVSENSELNELYCGGNLFSDLDVSACASLSILDCWSANLNIVLINPENDLNIAFYDDECGAPWTFQDVDGNIIEIGEEGGWIDYDYSAEDGALPITATNADGTQTIIIASEIAPLANPTLSEATVEMSKVSFTWDAVPNANGYQFEYKAVGSEEWLTKTVNKTSASFVGELGVEYTARVMALGTGAFTDSEYSNEQAVPQLEIVATFNAKKVTVSWLDESPAADTIRYRVANTAKWTTKKLKAGVTSFTFSPKAGTNYEVQVLRDQQEGNILQGPVVMLDQAKLKADKAQIHYDSFQVNVTNYTAKNLADNVTQAILTVNGVQTTVDIEDQFGESDLANGGKVTFENGLFTFTEMASNTTYNVQVSFTDDVSVSTMSKLRVKTLKASYEAPVITSATPLSDTSIEVTWETSHGQKTDTPAQKYTVQYSLDGNKWSNATTGATGNAYTIQKLKGGNNYQVRVLATKDNAFNASAASAVLEAETLATPKMALVKGTVTSYSFQISVANYAATNLVNATTLNVRSDKFGDVVIIVVNGAGSATFGNGMTVAFENGSLTFECAPANTQQKIQISFGNGICTTAWSSALSVKTAKVVL